MCEYCDDEEKTLLEDDVNNNNILQWVIGTIIDQKTLDLTDAKITVHIDRGYLRLSDPEDNQCMDHGEKIKINFCPMCGEGQQNEI